MAHITLFFQLAVALFDPVFLDLSTTGFWGWVIFGRGCPVAWLATPWCPPTRCQEHFPRCKNQKRLQMLAKVLGGQSCLWSRTTTLNNLLLMGIDHIPQFFTNTNNPAREYPWAHFLYTRTFLKGSQK